MTDITNKYESLPDDVAGKILQKAFQANAMESNTIPLESLVAYSNYRRERLLLQRVLAGLMFVIFLLLPFLFVLPKASMSADVNSEPGRPTYTVSVSRNRMVSSVKAVIGKNSMPVYQTDDGTYSVHPTENGIMTVIVRLYNDQSDRLTIEVTGVDREGPKLLSSEVKNGRIYLQVVDEGTGVDFERITAQDSNGGSVALLSVDREKGLLEFAYPSDAINLHLYDLAQNHLQLVITPKNNG